VIAVTDTRHANNHAAKAALNQILIVISILHTTGNSWHWQAHAFEKNLSVVKLI
jgi:hypothetical protein